MTQGRACPCSRAAAAIATLWSTGSASSSLHKNASLFLNVSYALSRACLGKMIVFSMQQWLNQRRFVALTAAC
jgi:hypothetical protein